MMLYGYRLLLTVAAVALPLVVGQPEPQLMSVIEEPVPEFAQAAIAPEECPLLPGCCEEDCCGPETFYSSPFCYPDPGGTGFIGVYPDDFDFGCVPRDCCESDCCGEGTVYDEAIASCIMVPLSEGDIAGAAEAPPLVESSGGDGIISGAAQAPPDEMIPVEGDEMLIPIDEWQGMEIGDGSIGSVCLEDADCDSDRCHQGMVWNGGYGYCACNSNTNAGCQDGYVCLANLEETQGIADAGPGCYLPFGADCTKGEYECVTGRCDEISGKCPCSGFTNWPCDVKNDEICMADPVEGHVCKVPYVSLPVVEAEGTDQIGEAVLAPDEAMEIGLEIPDMGMAIRAPYPEEVELEVGDGSLFSVCYQNEDCDSSYCNYGMIRGGYGSCTCNPATNSGCEEGYECYDNLIEAQRIADAPPGCYLPVGAACTPGEWDCLTGNCDKVTERCACSTFSQYPCDADMAICVNDEEKGHICEPVERTLGSDCLTNSHCDSGSCYFDPNIRYYSFDAAGFCVCTEESGCEDGYVCASGGDLLMAQMLADSPPRCMKDLGEDCDPTQRNCLSGVCDKTTKKCACNPGTNFGCNDEGDELCVLDENNSYVCQVPGQDVGIGSLGGESGPSETVVCPSPAKDVMCTMEYAPVICVGGCTYSNKCQAYSASDDFDENSCEPVK